MVDSLKKITYKNGSGQDVSVYTELKSSYGFYKNIITSLFGNKNTTDTQEALTQIDSGMKNGYLSSKEISIFTQKVQEYAAKDNNPEELSAPEAEELSKALGLTQSRLFDIMMELSSNALYQNIIKELSNKQNNKFSKDIFAEINEYNIASILKFDNNDKMIQEILSVYKENAQLYTDKIFEAMYDYAQKNNIEINTLADKYTKACANNNNAEITSSLKEIKKRISMFEEAKLKAKKYKKLNGEEHLTSKTKENIVKLAEKSGAVISDDLYGDGILGNTPSVPTAGTDSKSALVLNAVNDLLHDINIKEKLQACVSKHDNIIVVIFPGSKSYPGREFKQAVSEDSLNRNKNRVAQKVIGDADMSLLVDAIIEKAGSGDRKFTNFENQEALKKYILSLIDPNY